MPGLGWAPGHRGTGLLPASLRGPHLEQVPGARLFGEYPLSIPASGLAPVETVWGWYAWGQGKRSRAGWRWPTFVTGAFMVFRTL